MTGFDSLNSVSATARAAGSSEVYIEVGVLPAEVAPVRVVAADLAARADFDLDAVADLRMAVDEVCSTLATLAGAGERIRCHIEVAPDQMTVTARIRAPRADSVPRGTFGWRVLTTLADKVEILEQDGTNPPELGIRLVKERRAGAA